MGNGRLEAGVGFVISLDSWRSFFGQLAIGPFIRSQIVDNRVIEGLGYSALKIEGHFPAQLVDSLGRHRSGYVCCLTQGATSYYVPYFSDPSNPQASYIVEGVEVFCADFDGKNSMNTSDVSPNNRIQIRSISLPDSAKMTRDTVE